MKRKPAKDFPQLEEVSDVLESKISTILAPDF